MATNGTLGGSSSAAPGSSAANGSSSAAQQPGAAGRARGAPKTSPRDVKNQGGSVKQLPQLALGGLEDGGTTSAGGGLRGPGRPRAYSWDKVKLCPWKVVP